MQARAAGQRKAKGWLEEPLTAREKVLVSAMRGAIGGGIAGYVGGGVFDAGALVHQLLLGAGIGAVVGVVFGLLSAGGWLGVLKGVALWIPAGAAICAAVFGGKHLTAWTLGWAVNHWAHGLEAVLIGGILGGLAGMVFGFLVRGSDGSNPTLTA
jgi:hypothetical protein